MKISSIPCLLFGHVKVEEIYAKKKRCENKYCICRETKCYRCGKLISFRETNLMSRAELLQNEWFIVDNE